MRDLFRYMSWGIPAEADAGPGVIVISGPSPFRAKLAEARKEGDPAAALRRVATEFVAGHEYAMGSEALKLGDAYFDAFRALSKAESGAGAPVEQLLTGIFGAAPAAVVASADFKADKLRVEDSLIALKVLGGAGRGDDERLLAVIRTMHVVANAAQPPGAALSSGELRRMLGALVLVANELFELDRPPAPIPGGTSHPAPAGPDAAALEKLIRRLREVYDYITGLGSDSLVISGEGEGPLDPSGDRGFCATLRAFLRWLFGGRETGTNTSATELQTMLSPQAAAGLTEAMRATLAELGIDPVATPVTAMIKAIREALEEAQADLFELVPLAPTPVYSLGQGFFVLAGSGAPSPPGLQGPPEVKIEPVGFGDLHVVKQQILRYESGEVSYIENVMRGEHYDRSIRRRELREEVSVSERERIKEEERDLQATDRFELHTETENATHDSTTTAEGNTVTSQYGSFVETRGSNFARDVVNRAVDRVTERVSEQRTLRMQQELVEKTEHGFENREGQEHLSGVYQWVDKIYQAQIFNYGKRLLYEAVIPEPAAFAIEMRKRAGQPENLTLEKPPEPTFEPGDLSAWNYLYYARLYDVVGAMEPPPEEVKLVPHTVKGVKDGQNLLYMNEYVTVPEGYTAASIEYYQASWTGTPGVGPKIYAGSNPPFSWTWTLDGEPERLPLYVAARGIDRLLMNIMFSCQRTQEHLEKWQIRTYEALMKGYRRQLSEFEERLANVQALMRTQMLIGGSAGQHRATERVELKRAFLSLLTNQQFDAFDAIETPPPFGYPQVDIGAATANAGFITFFERAFEWENMLYFFYPYFWGRKGQWPQALAIDDPDPQFEAFMTAGAARVIVPVRPGFEAALAHYVETGEVWQGGQGPPVLGTALGGLVQELGEDDLAPGEELPVGEPWEVRLPTTLVHLRDSKGLPKWQQTPAGDWAPAP